MIFLRKSTDVSNQDQIIDHGRGNRQKGPSAIAFLSWCLLWFLSSPPEDNGELNGDEDA